MTKEQVIDAKNKVFDLLAKQKLNGTISELQYNNAFNDVWNWQPTTID